jgi:ATP-binding cassette subfamily B protein
MEKKIKTPTKRYRNLLVNYLKPQWLNVAWLAVLLLSGIGLQLVNPQILRYFIDTARAGSALQELTAAALLFLGVAVVSQALSLLTTYLSGNVAWTATNALRRDLTLHCLRLDMSFHKTHTPGELIERVDGDVTRLANFFSQMAPHLLGNGLLALGILVLLFREDWRVGVVGAGYALLTATALRAVQKPAVKAWGGSRQAHAELFGFLGERLLGTEDVRANGAEPYVMVRFYRLMRAVFHRWLRAQVVQSLSYNAGFCVYLLTQVATLAIGAMLFLRGQMTIGTAYLLIHYVGQLKAPLDRLQRQIDDLQQASASIERVEELLHTRPRLAESRRAELPAGALAVTFDGVAFRYDDGFRANGTVSEPESILEGISFELEPGKVLGLLGRTGSGKTTLTRLLFRLYDPTQGAIRLGGVDVRDARLSDLRRRIGLVTQDVQLFRASVRHNLTLFSRRIPDEHILDAFRALGLWDWYRSLPDGLDTGLQAGGKSLSAGEAQLLAFTRVFLKDPGLVVLDEASSRLDPATEQLLERAISRLLRHRTAVVIAHRLSTVQRADEIMVLEKGRICEHGPRQALANDPASRFYGLLQAGLAERPVDAALQGAPPERTGGKGGQGREEALV